MHSQVNFDYLGLARNPRSWFDCSTSSQLTANSLFQVPAALSTVEGRNFYRFYQNQLDVVLVQHLREEGTPMNAKITNYDGSVVMFPQKVVRAESMEHLQTILKDKEQFPSGSGAGYGQFSLFNPLRVFSRHNCGHVPYEQNTKH